jgi:protein-S-isoprenylcysteine O-methyltransferase Ste14
MNPTQAALWRVTLWAWGLWLVYWLAQALGAKKTVRREPLTSMLKQRLFLLPGYALLFWPSFAAGLNARWLPADAWTEGTGVGLCVLGLGYSVWARRALGSNWSGVVTLKEDHQLIQTGPYALSRHPIYTGLWCASFGVALEEGEVRGLLACAFILASFHLKSGVEERFMRDQFGADYEAYAAKVKKLIPYVY